MKSFATPFAAFGVLFLMVALTPAPAQTPDDQYIAIYNLM